MFFSKNDMFYSTRRLLAVILLVSLVLGPEKRRFKDPITTFSNLVLFFRNNSRQAVSLSLSLSLSFVHSFKPIMPFICILYRSFLLCTSLSLNTLHLLIIISPTLILFYYFQLMSVINAGCCPFFPLLFLSPVLFSVYVSIKNTCTIYHIIY
jgi:hypothetical protein